jgi:hypothetical protein
MGYHSVSKEDKNMSYIENSGYDRISKVDLENSIITGINALAQ